jgi:hypothetical protein
MMSYGRDVRIAKATKHLKISTCGWFVMDELKGCGVWCFGGWQSIKEAHGCG